MKKLSFQKTLLLAAIIVLGLASCREKAEVAESVLSEIREIAAEGKHIEEPFLSVAPTGQTFMSWIEKTDSLSSLLFAEWEGNQWSSPKLITSGTDWFVNWADYPQLEVFADGTLVAAFLQKSGPGTFSYDVMLTFSKDGSQWSKPSILHDDGTQTEHGFVSMTPWEDDVLITWLDGRNTGNPGHTAHGHDHGHHGQMTLRAARVNSQGIKLEEWELDGRVCDCCQTSVAMGLKGPIVAFRDRSETEIRDIGMVRWIDRAWTQAMPVNADFWEIAACPVNGPRIACHKERSAVVWYTGAQDKPRVQVLFSEDGGQNFGTPIRVDLGKTIGRVDIALDKQGKAWVTWMEEGAIYLRWIGRDGRKGNPVLIAESSGKRSSGFPQLAAIPEGLMVAWTDDGGDFRKISYLIVGN